MLRKLQTAIDALSRFQTCIHIYHCRCDDAVYGWITFAKELKRTSTIPLIFLSARGEEWDKMEGLKIGGDDYIVKPFLPGELARSVESVLRRSYQHHAMAQTF